MSEKIFPLPIKIPDMHYGHEAHLCVAEATGFITNNLDAYKEYVRSPRYVCKNCGRAAKSAENLCDPDAL